MTKTVLINLDDFTKILGCEGKTFYDGCRDPDLGHLKNFKAWFEAQPDASNDQVSQQTRNYVAKDIIKKCLKEIERAMNLLNEDKKSPRWHEAADLSKMETT